MTAWKTELPFVFVIGAAGAGTSAVAQLLSDVLELETIDLSEAIGAISVFTDAGIAYGRQLGAVRETTAFTPADYSRLAAEIILRGALEDREKPVVIDASDDMPAAPCLHALAANADLLPNAIFIVVEQDGVDYVVNRHRTRRGMDFAESCLLWNAAKRAAKTLTSAVKPKQFALVGYETVFDAAPALFDKVSGVLKLAAGRKAAFEKTRKALPERPKVFALKPGVSQFEEVGWSLAEKSLFAEICGQAMADRGVKLDIEKAVRTRPLRITDLMLSGDPIIVGESGEVAAPEKGDGATVRWSAADASSAALVLPGLWLDRRKKLDLKVKSAAPDDAPVNFRIDIVETLSRHVVSRMERILGKTATRLTADIGPTNQLVDLVLYVAPSTADQPFGAEIIDGVIKIK